MSIIDLFFPRQCKCIFCGKETSEFGICKKCNEKLPYLTGKTCSNCGAIIHGKGKVCIDCKNRFFNFERCYCILSYEDEVKKKIINLKQGGAKHIGETFAWLIEKKYFEINLKVDIIIPVPVSLKRLKERGFNQSEVLCSELKSTGKVNTSLLERVKDTPHQTGLSRGNREENLKDAFLVTDKKIIKGKFVLLVDDIYTTGSTLDECARVLMKAGAERVVCLCLARTPVKTERIVSGFEKTNSIAFEGD